MRILLTTWRALPAALAAALLAPQAQAQYAPSGQPPQAQYGQAQAQYGPQPTAQYGPQAPTQSGQQPAGQYDQQAPAQYAARGVYQTYPQTQPQAYGPTQAAGPMQGGAFSQSVPYTAMNFQPTAQTTPAPTENMQLAAPTENVQPGAMQGGGYPPQAQPQSQPAPMSEGYGAAGMSAPGMGAGCNCQSGGYESYPGGYGSACNTAYGAGNYGSGCGSNYSTYGPAMGRLLGKDGCGYWFGGVYGLLMDKSDGDKVAVAMTSPIGQASGYPPSSNIVLTTDDADIGFQGGVEVRLGRTFGCDCCSCGPKWGFEAVYWDLFSQSSSSTYVVNPAVNRLHSMLDLRGLQVNMGALGYRPADVYWDYAPPVTDYTGGGPNPQILVSQINVYDKFQAQDLELNLLRLSICSNQCGGCDTCAAVGASAMGNGCGGCGGGGSCGGYGGGACGGCDSGCNACGGGNTCGGGSACGCDNRYFITGVCGIRYMHFDETFRLNADFYEAPTPANTGFLNYNSVVRNDLVGPQIGCNGTYCVGCKWGFHLDSTVGIFGNGISVHQYLQSPTNLAQYISSSEAFDAHADETDFAMISEIRAGVSYQASCHCRVYGGWRVIGVTGFAQANNQMPGAFIDSPELNNYVNNNSSLILHGLEAGLEWNY